MDAPSLEGLLGFSDEDLAANRDGDLSGAQRNRLLWSGTWRLIVGPLALLAGAGGALLSSFALLTLAAVGGAGIGLYLTWTGFAFLVDGLEGVVAFVTAPLRRHLVHTRNGTSHYADLGPVHKHVRARAYDALPVDLSCNLYYAPGCRSLLSVEPATAGQPLPNHPFGPDSAHAWDRVRWAWVLFTIGALGVMIGAYQVAGAHPAKAYVVKATVADYQVRHGKNSTYRDLYLAGDSSSYSMQAEATYDPPVQSFAVLVGRPVALYVNQGTRDGIAIDDGEQLHTADWYRHPEHQTVYQAANGGITAAGSVVAFLGGVVVLLVRRSPRPASDRYTPPTVRPMQSHLSPTVMLAVVLVVASLGLALLLGAHH